MSNAVGQRYAKALFELAKEKKSLPQVSASLDALSSMVSGESEKSELRDFLHSPLYSREEQGKVVAALSKKAKFDDLTGNTLGLMAQKGRLPVVEAMISSFKDLVSAENEEVVAHVVSAQDMTAAQQKKLAQVLKEKVGKDVEINVEVDPEILGGLVINIGSTMIDNSLKGKLSKLHNSMKEVG